MSLSFPLTTMEEFFYWENRPAYPCSCFTRLKFSGRLDRDAFDKAIGLALPRHPMFTATVAPAVRRRPRWTPVDDPRPLVLWEETAFDDSMPPAAFQDLHREIGIRFHARIGESSSDLTIQMHHSCADGLGICEFISDFLIAYAKAKGAEPIDAQLPRRDASLLANRGKYGLTFGKLLRMAPKQAVGLLGARQFLMRKPVPVVPHRAPPNDSPAPANYPAVLHRVLSCEATRRLRDLSRQGEATMNDMLAARFFLTLADWRLRNNLDNSQWLRMMVPMNMRSAHDRFMPAANMVSNVFLDRRGDDFSDPERLLRTVHDEMELIKRLKLGYTFIFSTAACRFLPGGLEKQIHADKCEISCILTNVGAPFAKTPLPHHDGCIVTGDLTLVDIDFVAPLRPYSCITFAAAIYAHKLSITMHYDPRPLSQTQAAEILDDYTKRLEA